MHKLNEERMQMDELNTIISQNVKALKKNSYPGRGIILGMTPDGQNLVQVYWIMGRSANSRNRIFEAENDGSVKTKAYDEAKVEDPSLIIYYPARHEGDCHIISNGDQTDTIYQAIQNGDSFEDAIITRTFEPDAPNFTPRISGIMDVDNSPFIYQLAVIKSIGNNPEYATHHFFNYQKALPGVGHCIHTYAGDGNPLPAFYGEPYPVNLGDDIREVASFYWDLLNPENKISLMVKFIHRTTKKMELQILNKLLGD
jgi:IMP cyclohydrolase